MISPYYLSPTGLARVKAEAQLMGARLRKLRAQRELAARLKLSPLPALPALPEIRL